MAVTLHAHTMSAVLSGNRGAVGVGIADITFNDDYTMTITLTDGSTYTSGNLRGAQGIPGIDAEFDGEELVITTGDHTETDGGEVSTIRVKGEARVIRDRITEGMTYSAYPTETASGDIVSITDGAEDIPVKALTVAVEPKQAGSGDPSPDNVRPITGWDAVNVVRRGKNLWNTNANALTVGTINGDTGADASSSNRVRNTEFIPFPFDSIVAAGYAITVPTGYNVAVRFYDSEKHFVYAGSTYSGWISGNIFDNAYIGKDVQYVKCVFRKSNDSAITVDDVVNAGIQLELGSSATAYEPYHGTTYPIPLPSTVYGGTLDVATGVMTVTHGIVEASTLAWQVDTNNSRFWAAVAGSNAADTRYSNAWADFIPLLNEGGTASAGVNGFTFSSNSRVYMALKTLSITTVADLNTFLSGKGYKFVYPLATPTTITLGPTTISTLLGSNTLYADAGQVSVAYRADVGLYIDKRIAEVQALVLDNE